MTPAKRLPSAPARVRELLTLDVEEVRVEAQRYRAATATSPGAEAR